MMKADVRLCEVVVNFEVLVNGRSVFSLTDEEDYVSLIFLEDILRNIGGNSGEMYRWCPRSDSGLNSSLCRQSLTVEDNPMSALMLQVGQFHELELDIHETLISSHDGCRWDLTISLIRIDDDNVLKLWKRSQDGIDDKDNDKGSKSRSQSMKEQAYNKEQRERPRPHELNDKSNLIDLMKECHQ
ncbi:hypothetical protein Tco_0932626 [Tanacetum coccineum]